MKLSFQRLAMTERTLSIPESVYQRLLLAAQKKGVSPVQWIDARLPSTSLPEPLTDFPEDLIGSIDSGSEACHSDDIPPARERDLFGEGVVAKMAKQGIFLP